MNRIIRSLLINTIIGLVYYSYIYYSETGNFPIFHTNLRILISLILVSNILGFVISKFNRQLNKLIFWKRNFSMRFTLGVIFNYVLSTIFIFGFIWLYLLIFHENFGFLDFLNGHNEITVRIFVLTFFSVFIFVIIDFSIFSYNQYSVVQIESVKLLTHQIELQYEALKTQLSPHYLFNSLNTISSLIYKDASLTEKFIRKLAGTYQYILDSDNKKLIEISRELEFIEAYKFLMDVRFGKSINIEFEIDDSLKDFVIPPLSIQILIENAVKHNVFDDENILQIKVFNESSNKLIVENNKLKKPSSTSSFNIGLTNIKNRYAFFTDQKIQIINNDTFKVAIPLLKQKKSSDKNSEPEIFKNSQKLLVV